MRRAVLDSGVLVSALIAPGGPPAKLLDEVKAGELELIVSPLLLAELERVLLRDKFRRYVDLDAVQVFVHLLRQEAFLAPNPEVLPRLRATDPDDDYLIALAHSQSVRLVSGDSHLLRLAEVGAPICSPADFLTAALA